MTKVQLQRGMEKARAAFVAESMAFFIVYLTIAAGIPIIINPEVFAPTSIQTHLLDWVIRCWGLDLAAGGLLVGTGLLAERPHIERAGLALLFTGASIFSVVVFLYAGWAALLPCLTYAFFAISAIARFRKLGSVLRGIELARSLTK